MRITALDVAKYMIAQSAKKQSPISNLKLQKLLYYCQAWHLASERKALFPDVIEAWVHGPVVPTVFQHYREYKWTPIKESTIPALPSDKAMFVNKVLAAYGKLSAEQLERLSHKEEPWLMARKNLPPHAPSTAEISLLVMRDYFFQQLNA
jgi:uncharacterized phage-associated protein